MAVKTLDSFFTAFRRITYKRVLPAKVHCNVTSSHQQHWVVDPFQAQLVLRVMLCSISEKDQQLPVPGSKHSIEEIEVLQKIGSWHIFRIDLLIELHSVTQGAGRYFITMNTQNAQGEST